MQYDRKHRIITRTRWTPKVAYEGPREGQTSIIISNPHLSLSLVPDLVEKRKRILMESVDRAYRIKCEVDLICGVRSEIGLLAWMMGSHD